MTYTIEMVKAAMEKAVAEGRRRGTPNSRLRYEMGACMVERGRLTGDTKLEAGGYRTMITVIEGIVE